MDKKKRSYLRIIGWGCTFVFLFLIVWIGIVWLNRPAYIEPDTSTFKTGDVFFSVGDSWESVAVRTLSGSLSLEVADSTPSHCGIVVRYAEGVKLAHASTVKRRSYSKRQRSTCATMARTASTHEKHLARWTPSLYDSRWRRW